MPGILSLPRISTNVRFAASALLFPELAGAWAERLFLTPPRNGGAAAALDLIEARASFLEHKGRHIATIGPGRLLTIDVALYQDGPTAFAVRKRIETFAPPDAD